MKMTRAALEAMLDSMGVEGDQHVEFFPASTFYAETDAHARKVGQTSGLHAQGVFVKASA